MNSSLRLWLSGARRRTLVLVIVSLAMILLFSAVLSSGQGSRAAPNQRNDVASDQGGVGYGASSAGSGALKQVDDVLVNWLRKNPTIYPIQATGVGVLTKVILQALIPLYEIVILLLGMYIIFVALIPPRRAHAKAMFSRLLTGLILVSLSPMVYQLLLEIEDSLITQVYTGAGFTPTTADVVAVLALLSVTIYLIPYMYNLGLFVLAAMLLFPLLILARYIVVGILGSFFPMTLFLYFFEIGRASCRERV